MPKYIQITATFELYEDHDADLAADQLNEDILDVALDHESVVRAWVSTLAANHPQPMPSDQEK